MDIERPKLTKAGELASILSAVVGAIALVVALFAWLDPRSADKNDGSGKRPNASITPTVELTPSFSVHDQSQPAAIDKTSSLAALKISSGKANVERTPRKVRGKIDRDSVAIPCGTGEVKDQFREVAFVTSASFESLHAVLAPQRLPGPEVETSSVQVEIFIDGVIKSNKVIRTGDEETVDLSLIDSSSLRIRVTCSNSGAVLWVRSALT